MEFMGRNLAPMRPRRTSMVPLHCYPERWPRENSTHHPPHTQTTPILSRTILYTSLVGGSGSVAGRGRGGTVEESGCLTAGAAQVTTYFVFDSLSSAGPVGPITRYTFRLCHGDRSDSYVRVLRPFH